MNRLPHLSDHTGRGPTWADVLPPDQRQRFALLRLKAEVRRVEAQTRRLDALAAATRKGRPPAPPRG